MGRGKGVLRNNNNSNSNSNNNNNNNNNPIQAKISSRRLMKPLPSLLPMKRPTSPTSPSTPSGLSPVSPKRPRTLQIPRYYYGPHRSLEVNRLLSPPETSSRLIDIFIPAEYVVSSHYSLAEREIWGSGPYTDDSDLIAVLKHTGRYAIPAVRPSMEFLKVRIKIMVMKKGEVFTSSLKNGIKSRYWGDMYQGCGIEIDEVQEVFEDRRVVIGKPAVVTKLGYIEGLVQCEQEGEKSVKKDRWGSVVVYDLCFEPCLKFNFGIFVGTDGTAIKRLEREVVYVENGSARFEVAKIGEKFRFGRVKKEVIWKIVSWGIGFDRDEERNWSFPMKEDDVDVIGNNLKWSDFYWDEGGVTVKGNHYLVTKLLFRKVDQ